MKHTQHRLDNSSYRYLSEIDYIKAVSIVGVVFVHMGFESRLNTYTLHWISVIQTCLGWCVLSFFFCSGILFKGSLEISLEAVKKISQKKALRLLVPYFIFNILYKFILLVISLSDAVQWTLSAPGSLIGYLAFIFVPVEPQLYFLVYLFAAIFLHYTLYLLSGSKIFPYYFVLIIAFIYYALTSPIMKVNGSAFETYPLYLLSYIFGTVMSLQLHRPSKEVSYLWLFLIVFASILSYWKSSLLYSYVLIPPVLFLLIGRLRLIKNWTRKNHFFLKPIQLFLLKPIRLIGQNSGAIYLWHTPILMPLLSIASTRLLGDGTMSVFAILISSISASCCMNFFIGKFTFLRLLKF